MSLMQVPLRSRQGPGVSVDVHCFCRFPCWAPGRLGYPPGSILGSVFLWRCFCRHKPHCSSSRDSGFCTCTKFGRLPPPKLYVHVKGSRSLSTHRAGWDGFENWPGKALKNVRGFAPHLFEGLPGPPGPARLPARLPSGTQENPLSSRRPIREGGVAKPQTC